jgi:cytochrome o ubiquinol oxidase subunit 2
LGLIVVLAIILQGHTVDILAPKGIMATKERNLMYVASFLALLVLVPVYFMIFLFAWRYRENNHKAKYTPEWDGSRQLETIWWGIPIVIIGVLIVITWQSSHALDPFKPISSKQAPLNIQVIAMQYKWLFIYPEEHIASVNYIQVPTGRPLAFSITSDAPMNSFWVPQLGGQVYAMAGMETQLHLQADAAGVYNGSSANLSGEGFAGMKFKVAAVSPEGYATWVSTVRKSQKDLTQITYNSLTKPGIVTQQTYYGGADDSLFDSVIMKYMTPHHHVDDTTEMTETAGYSDAR